ncbi:MAG: biopolymer transporter ExbD [Microcoleus sp. SIO2G3]|nr:biopolymer transporter ExbD [Microcoleus sp. SIO2G3]
MPFRNRKPNSQVPEVNLVPMMDVLMTVLTFFIIISMTLTGTQIPNIFLPEAERTGGQTAESETAQALVVGLNEQRQIIIDGQPIDQAQLTQQMQAFLSENPEGIVLLKADRSLTYRDVAGLLRTMRDIGGSRVSLGIEPS